MSSLTRSSSLKRSAEVTDALTRASKRPRNSGRGFEAEQRSHDNSRSSSSSRSTPQVAQLKKSSAIYSKPVAVSSSSSAKRSSNKIAIPRHGDTKGPTQYTPPSTRSRSASVVPEDEGMDSEDEMQLPSSSSAARARNAAVFAQKPLAIVGSRKPILKPQHKGRSSRTRGNINALMSGANGATRSDLKDESPSKPEASNAKKPDAPTPVTLQDLSADVDDSDIDDSEDEFRYDVVAPPAVITTSPARVSLLRPTPDLRSILPSPAPSDQSQTTAPAVVIAHTPSKQRRVSGPASAKRTPTRAVKVNPATDAALSAPIVQLFTPASTPARAATPAVDLAYSPQEATKLLHTVLRQLASPCHALCSSAYTATTNPRDAHWLAQQPCLSASHEAAEKDVRNTLDRTIRAGEGNCMLLVGERGIGKTAIIERSLQLMRTVHGEDSMLVIRLSGLIHRDDKAALREIAKRLSSSAYIEDDEDAGSSSLNTNASVLSSLLAILEPGQADTADAQANLAKPLVFIIDEFDTFAHHSVRQSFLYCLLDCVQGGFRRGGMAVIGISARADCIETLEKRVKSRCQSRVHHVLPSESPFTGTVKTLEQAMMIHPGDRVLSATEEAWNTVVSAFFSSKTTQMQISSMDELRGFGAEHRLFDTMTATVARMLHDFLRLSSSAASTTACFHIPQDALVGSLQAPERLIPPNLSIAEVALLISAKHIAEEEKTLNFAIMYERYADHAKRATVSGASSARPFSRAVCLRAYQRLRALRIFADISGSGRGSAASGTSAFRTMRLIPWPHMIDEAIKIRREIAQDLVKWCKNWSE